MAGKVIDLTRPGVVIPDVVLLDTTVVVTGFVALGRPPSAVSARSRVRVAAFLATMAARRTLAFVAAASFLEVTHLILRTRFANDLPRYPNPASGRPFPSWTRLYKARPALVRRYAADVERLRRAIEVAGIEVLQPANLGPIASGRRFEEELIRLIRRYRLDSADAAILMEARRAGIDSVVSDDPDWRRAGRDFDVYTWW